MEGNHPQRRAAKPEGEMKKPVRRTDNNGKQKEESEHNESPPKETQLKT